MLLTTDGEPSDLAVLLFTQGDCWLLAWELLRLTGRPLTALVFAEPTHRSYSWMHISVDLGRERLLDVEGVRDRADALAVWSGRAGADLEFLELGRPASLDEMFRLLDDTLDGLYASQIQEDNARTVARALADLHVPLQENRENRENQAYQAKQAKQGSSR